MNRRQSLKALAIGSVGGVVPLPSLAKDSSDLPCTEAVIAPKSIDTHTDDGKLAAFILVAPEDFISRIREHIPAYVRLVAENSANEKNIIQSLAEGGSMVWIGRSDNIPKDLWIGTFVPSQQPLKIKPSESCPLPVNELVFNAAHISSGFIKPPKEMPMHNIDEEVRAEFIPILDAYDKFGNLAGYAAVLMSYYAPSLAKRRFKGSECFFFFTDEPVEMATIFTWKKLLRTIFARHESGLQVKETVTQYAAYFPGERPQVSVRIQNTRPKAVSCTLKIFVSQPLSEKFVQLTETPRVAEGNSETQAVFDFLPASAQPGLWKVRVQIWQDTKNAELLAFSQGEKEMIDSRDIGFMVFEKNWKTPEIFRFNGPSIVIDNQEGFWVGTHYYPSTSWWEWVWKDFRPLKADEDFAAIRKAGYRIVRIWIDPILDEIVLRAMDATIYLAAKHGIVLDICIFTQWVKYIGFERSSGEHVQFEFRNPADFNIVSFSLRNLDLQREYIKVLGSRWKNAGNIFYNIANEVYVKNPDKSQLDEEVFHWPENNYPSGPNRDSLLFGRWAQEMTKALREAGADQPAVPGYMFSTLNGGDVYLGNMQAPLLPWHSYLPTEQTASTIQYFDPISSNRPLLLEEFGRLGWNNLENYQQNVHYALASGAAAAMSYEWGVSWLCRESCFWPTPLLEASVENPDPRWFAPYVGLKKTWSEKGVGMCPTPSGTGYGSIYHGTPFPAEAAVALGRLGLMGQELHRVTTGEKVYVIIPHCQPEAIAPVQAVLSKLWNAKLMFGIWQEADLATLPATTKAVICPVPLSSGIQHIKQKGIKMFVGTDAWRSCKNFDKADITNGDNVDLIGRRTAGGVLYTLINKKSRKNISINYQKLNVDIGLEDFVLAHFSTRGIVMLEGTGEFFIDRFRLCSISNGNLIIASQDKKSLVDSRDLRMLVSSPAKIDFHRQIDAVAISDGLQRMPAQINYPVVGNTLDVDDQLAKYVIHVSLK